jgi:hypothetical protein
VSTSRRAFSSRAKRTGQHRTWNPDGEPFAERTSHCSRLVLASISTSSSSSAPWRDRGDGTRLQQTFDNCLNRRGYTLDPRSRIRSSVAATIASRQSQKPRAHSHESRPGHDGHRPCGTARRPTVAPRFVTTSSPRSPAARGVQYAGSSTSAMSQPRSRAASARRRTRNPSANLVPRGMVEQHERPDALDLRADRGDRTPGSPA